MTNEVDLTNDFGFSFHGENEINEVKQEMVLQHAAKVSDILDLIQPLLNNLKKNPDKDYIYWPNRVAKIEEFEKKLRELST